MHVQEGGKLVFVILPFTGMLPSFAVVLNPAEQILTPKATLERREFRTTAVLLLLLPAMVWCIGTQSALQIRGFRVPGFCARCWIRGCSAHGGGARGSEAQQHYTILHNRLELLWILVSTWNPLVYTERQIYTHCTVCDTLFLVACTLKRGGQWLPLSFPPLCYPSLYSKGKLETSLPD